MHTGNGSTATAISDMIREAWERQDPMAWFETVYQDAQANGGEIPWAYGRPHPGLLEWLAKWGIKGKGRSAIVVGSGLGDDAEALAQAGFVVTAFDISETAITMAKARFPESAVDYRVANLLDLPPEWDGAFDFVLESRTIQSLPHHMSDEVIQKIAGLVAPMGRLLVLCRGRDPHHSWRGIPWPLSKAELSQFYLHGLTERYFDDYVADGVRRFTVEYSRRKA